MPAKTPPTTTPPPMPAGWKVLALLGWLLFLAFLIALDRVDGKTALIVGGAPVAVVMGVSVRDVVRALLVKR